MADLLVRLYDLPPLEPAAARLAAAGINLRPALAPERHLVVDWVQRTFGPGWASECACSFARQPVACHLATQDNRMLGFACYDAVCRDFFGPTGVGQEHRGRGVGAGLLLSCLHAMRAFGYAYAIIGGAGPVDFYQRVAGAQVIADSTPGIYRGMLRPQEGGG